MKKSERMRDTNSPRDHPGKFYSIEEQGDGTANVYLIPNGQIYDTDIGIKEFDVDLRVVRGIEIFPGMEEDIRMRYEAWLESAEIIHL